MTNMLSYLDENEQLRNTLLRLHRSARTELRTILKGLLKGIFRKLRPEDMREAFIAVSPEQGRRMYQLIIDHQCRHIVEFGTSFGISTLYLAAGAKMTGGKVITTEILHDKMAIAKKHFTEASVADVIDPRLGDALTTLQDVPSGIEFLLLDGWNDLYLPLLRLLEPKFMNGCVIVSDNVNFRSAKPFLQYLQNNRSYTSAIEHRKSGRTNISVFQRQLN